MSLVGNQQAQQPTGGCRAGRGGVFPPGTRGGWVSLVGEPAGAAADRWVPGRERRGVPSRDTGRVGVAGRGTSRRSSRPVGAGPGEAGCSSRDTGRVGGVPPLFGDPPHIGLHVISACVDRVVGSNLKE